MNKQIKSRGFTIVELLIVIVIIAILAAITMVAYNGITNRAHGSAAKQTAQNVGNKADAFNAENGTYPSSLSDLNDTTKNNTTTGSSWYLPASAYTAGTTSAKPANDNTVTYTRCTGNNGATVQYWDFEKGSQGTMTFGSC